MSGASHVLSGQQSFEVPVGNTMAGQYHLSVCQRDTSVMLSRAVVIGMVVLGVFPSY